MSIFPQVDLKKGPKSPAPQSPPQSARTPRITPQQINWYHEDIGKRWKV